MYLKLLNLTLAPVFKDLLLESFSKENGHGNVANLHIYWTKIIALLLLLLLLLSRAFFIFFFFSFLCRGQQNNNVK